MNNLEYMDLAAKLDSVLKNQVQFSKNLVYIAGELEVIKSKTIAGIDNDFATGNDLKNISKKIESLTEDVATILARIPAR